MDEKFQKLYQKVVMDHTKNPRNFYAMSPFDSEGEGENPMCGDSYHIYMKEDAGVISEISFQGAGCAISKSSASLLTTQLVGKSIADAKKIVEQFNQLVHGEVTPEELENELGDLVAFAGISAFPTRIKCAVLAWQAFENALDQK